MHDAAAGSELKSPDLLTVLRIREEQQAAIAHLGQLALSTSDVDKLCSEAVTLLAKHLDVEMAKVLELVPERNELLLKAGVGWQDGLVGTAFIPAGTDSQAGFTLETAGAIIVTDLRTEARFTGPELLISHGVVSGLSVVIDGRPQPFGVLGAHTRSLRHFTIDDVNFLLAVANVIASAVERAEAEAELQRATQRLEQIVRSKDEFVAAVAHELRTPMTAVLGLSVELRDRYEQLPEHERREFVSVIAAQSMEVSGIIDDLLVSARADIGGVTVESRRLHVAQAVHQAVATLTASGHRPVSVTVDEALFADGDPARLRQILRNLVSNALRYGGHDVGVTASVESGFVVITVHDSGQVIAEQDRERIFRPYERAHDRPTQPASVGLGLSISRTLAVLMGGDLVYRPIDGCSAFCLFLPAA